MAFSQMNTLFYNNKGKYFNEALPLGNGFTGVMLYGSSKNEKLVFNDGTLWSGYPKDYNSAESYKNLDNVRQLIFDGKNHEADRLAQEKLKGFYTESFMPLGTVNLMFKYTESKNFKRELDIEHAVASVTSDDFNAECFASYPEKMVVYRAKSKKPFSLKIKMKSKLKSEVRTDDCINLLGNAPDYAAPSYVKNEIHPIRYDEGKGMSFCLRCKIVSDGDVSFKKDCVIIKNAKKVTLYFVTSTGFKGFDKMPSVSRNEALTVCRERLNSIKKNYVEIKKEHVSDFSSLFNNESVSFYSKNDLPTDKLIKNFKKRKNEKELIELFYNYGKYLTISSSRKGGQPINLQGIWNNKLRAPWSCNYTVNINTQMNYWGSSRAGLSECIEPIIKMVLEATENGRKTSEINYGCEGFSCNHNVDIWRKTPPVQGDAGYMFEPLCGVWLGNEIYSHYKNGGLNLYKNEVKKITAECAEFCCGYLVLHNSYYVTCPSASPENSFILNGKKCSLDYASAFEMAIVRECFQNALQICDDEALLKNIKTKLDKLYPYKNGKYGICEWHKDYELSEKGHRHFSPLYAFYPGTTIGYSRNPQLRNGVKQLFDVRIKNSGQHIGWSAAWAICIASRLRDSEKTHRITVDLLSKAIFKNLFCMHPPYLFQIDGNLGFVAAINEMILTKEDDIIELLPAIFQSLENGKAENILIDGAKISFEWLSGKVTKIKSDKKIKVKSKNVSSNAEISDNIELL